jgi:hypothetical protein
MKESFFYKKSELLKLIRVQKEYPYIQIFAALTQLIDDQNEFIADKYGRDGRLVNIGEYYLFQPVELSNKNTTIFDRSVPIDYKHDMIKFTIKKDIAKSNFEKQISKLEEKLEEIGLKIKKYYYISETFYNKDEDRIAYLKSKLVIQHLLGLKTDGDIFTNEEIDNYNQITFYDDDLKSIQMCRDINSVLGKLLLKTDSNIKIIVKDKIKNDDNFLLVKEYTHNKSLKFKEYNVQLEYSNIIKSFEGFKNK